MNERPIWQAYRLPGGGNEIGGWKYSERVQKGDDVGRPADRYGGGSHSVFQDKIPSNYPSNKFAHCDVGIGVSAAAYRDHCGQFAVAQCCKGARYGGNNKGDHYGRASMISSGDPCNGEKSSTYNAAYSQKN